MPPAVIQARGLDHPEVEFYKSFARPFSKVFLLALFVYQTAYWSWLKLETGEVRRNKEHELRSLEESLVLLSHQRDEASTT